MARLPKAPRPSWWVVSRGCNSHSTSHGRRPTASSASSRQPGRGLLKMNDVQLRVPLGLGHLLHETVFAQGEHEWVAFCLVSHALVEGKMLLAVRHVLGLREIDYLENAAAGA